MIVQIINYDDNNCRFEKVKAGDKTRREIVGGDLELITLDTDFKLRMYINEAGKILNLPYNALATEIYRTYFNTDDYIAGNAIICAVNDEGVCCSLNNYQKKDLVMRSRLSTLVSDPLGLLGKCGNVAGVYEMLLENSKDNISTSIYIGEAGYIDGTPEYVAQNVRERLTQHLHRWIGSDYIEYWLGLSTHDAGTWKIRLNLLCEEQDIAKRKELESHFIETKKPLLQDTADGKFSLYPHKDTYTRNDVCISPWHGQRREALLYRLEELKKAQ